MEAAPRLPSADNETTQLHALCELLEAADGFSNQQVGIAGVALGTVAAVARAAGRIAVAHHTLAAQGLYLNQFQQDVRRGFAPR